MAARRKRFRRSWEMSGTASADDASAGCEVAKPLAASASGRRNAVFWYQVENTSRNRPAQLHWMLAKQSRFPTAPCPMSLPRNQV